MRRAANAGHRSGNRQGCLKGTRGDVLSQLECWANDEQDKRVFWLNGHAGTGKSAIAQTFAETSFADGKLGASFFCSRDFDDRSDLRMIFPTLAFQLAYRYPRYRQKLLQDLKESPYSERGSLVSQIEKLIVGPFRATQIPTLIVIDALDECRDEGQASALLSVLGRYVNDIPLVKFFVTARPEPRIQAGFHSEPLERYTEVLELHSLKRSLVDDDIKLFLRTRLAQVGRNRGTKDWLSPDDIDVLCTNADGLFTYASTVVEFIASNKRQPKETLALVISLPQSTFLDGMLGFGLSHVLEQASDGVEMGDEEFYSPLRIALGAVLLTFSPLSVKMLSDLLRMPYISKTLHHLHSILIIPEDENSPVRVLYKSVSNLLTDSERCTSRLFIHPPTHHRGLLLSCFSLMEKLKRDICNLGDHINLSEVVDLSARRENYIGGALEYACCFWVNHLAKISASGTDVEEVQKGIEKFFTTRLLYWIEVLCLTGNLSTSIHALKTVQEWYTSVSHEIQF